jgi:hypothetical protein
MRPRLDVAQDSCAIPKKNADQPTPMVESVEVMEIASFLLTS